MTAVHVYIYVCIWDQRHWLGVINWQHDFSESRDGLMLMKVFNWICLREHKKFSHKAPLDTDVP